jgi:hypothetical protein
MLSSIMTVLLILTLCAESSAAIDQSVPSSVLESIFWWLPENTETLIVANGPFTIIDPDTNESNDLKHSLEQASYGPLSIIQQGKLLKPILGQTVLLSVEGSRKFHPPADLGSMQYEGCHVLIFGQDFAAVRASFIKSLETQAKEVQKIAGYQVMMFEQELESDGWTVFIVSPKPDVVLYATDQGFLTEVLNRMESKARNRALPESLPEWKQVDTTAQFWAVRHYDKENALRDTTSPLSGRQAAANVPDKQAIGITLTYNSNGKNEARINYLSGNTEATRIAEKYWHPGSYKLDAKIIKSEPGVVEIAINPDSQDTFPIFLLALLAAFGHAIYI